METIPCPASPEQAPSFNAGWLDCLPPQADVLRDYQREHLAKAADAIGRNVRRILMQGPTGSGKTHEIGAITATAVQADLRVLILATRTRLVKQLHERLDAFGVRHGIRAAAMPGHTDHAALVQVCSVDTLYRRCLVDERAPLPAADVVIFDEAHLSTGPSRLAILEGYPHALRIGFTATPAKISGRALGDHFDELVVGPTTRELIARGLLVRPRIFNQPLVTRDELKAVSRDPGTNDFTASGLASVMGRPKLVGDVRENWLRIASGKRTLVFACNKAHGEQIVLEFRQAGIAAELLTDQTAEDEREAAIERFERRETLVLVSCFLLSYGVDIPCIECISLARPTRSLILYLQTVGRGLRPAPGKEHCIVIDHGRCVETLGLPHEDFGWSLEHGSNASTAAITARGRQQTAERSRECAECHCLWLVSDQGPSCPACGWQPAPKAKAIGTTEADLGELNVAEAAVTPQSPAAVRFFQEAAGHYAQRWPDRWMESPGKGRFFAWCKTRERFKFAADEPIPSAFWRLEPRVPSKETLGWLLHAAIKYAKRRCGQAA